MKTWYECKVKYTKIDEATGNPKKVTEPYLVDAVSFTDAESRIYKEVESLISGEFTVTTNRKTNYTYIFPFDCGINGIWYKCKVSYISMDEAAGKVKKVSNMMLVMADDVKEAFESLQESLSDMIVNYDIVSIADSNIVDVFWFDQDVEEVPTQCVSKNPHEEYGKCVNCGKELNMSNKEHTTSIDGDMHRYVCNSTCLHRYYHPD